MSHWAFAFSFYITCLCIPILSLDIVNISTPKQLTRIFLNESYSKINNMDFIAMTYYISPNDPTKTKYVWYEMFYEVNDAASVTGIISNIFNKEFTQNNAVNNLPLTIQEITANPNGRPAIVPFLPVVDHMCTNPITNDILSCWYSVTLTSEKFECNIYFTENNTLSDIINIGDGRLIQGFISGSGVICFDDSYLIAYSNNNQHSSNFYAVLVDLQGNIRYNRLMMNVSNAASVFLTAKGGNNFNAKSIDSAASDLFIINYGTVNETTNFTSVQSFYGYYTSINSADAIHIYNDSITLNTTWPRYGANFDELYSPSIVDYKQDCCYILLYNKFTITPNGQLVDLGILITDINGNQIDIKQYPNYTEVLLLRNVSYIAPLFVDLNGISDENTHYFAIFYYPETYHTYPNVTSANIYYLQQDEKNPKQYDLMEAGTFETAKIVNNGISNYQDIWDFDVYNLPNTNDIYISWVQDGNRDIGHFDVYGQTFQVK